jgi:hypothetical protein
MKGEIGCPRRLHGAGCFLDITKRGNTKKKEGKDE